MSRVAAANGPRVWQPHAAPAERGTGSGRRKWREARARFRGPSDTVSQGWAVLGH